MLEMYSGLLNYYDPHHMERIYNEMAQYGGTIEIIPVECTILDTLLKKYNISHVDLLSIDIEGGEEAIIKTIDFDSVTINIILVENNFGENNIEKYLKSKKYRQLLRMGKDDIYQLME
jgi:FkbM family methyltransferase